MYVRVRESFIAGTNSTVISTHVQADGSKSGCYDLCMNLYITHVMIVGREGGGGGGATQLSMKMIKSFAPANNVLSFSHQGFIG